MSDLNNRKHRGVLRRYLLLLPVLALGLLSIVGSGGGPGVQPTPIDWWTGAVHGTLYGRFALQNSTEGPPTAACNGSLVPPPARSRRTGGQGSARTSPEVPTP